jgi:hypothetical protein
VWGSAMKSAGTDNSALGSWVQVVRLCFKLAVAVTSGLGLTGLNKGRVPDCTGHMQTIGACMRGWLGCGLGRHCYGTTNQLHTVGG